MPVHRTNMLMQTFNQPKFEIETPVETIETEIIISRRENKRLPFIEANTKEDVYKRQGVYHYQG